MNRAPATTSCGATKRPPPAEIKVACPRYHKMERLLMASRHFGGHASGAHTNTDAAPGQAHSASGGQYGSPHVRPAPATSRPGVHTVIPVGKIGK